MFEHGMEGEEPQRTGYNGKFKQMELTAREMRDGKVRGQTAISLFQSQISSRQVRCRARSL